MENSLRGKIVLITGGSAGIGRAAAKLFAEAGATVVIAARGVDRGRQVQEEIRASGGTALFIKTDVSQHEQVASCIAQTVAEHGRLDCAFNNAAVLSKLALTAAFSEDDFDTEVAMNLKSIWLSMKYELQQMQTQNPQGGTIVNTSSVNGLGGARSGSLYSMSKAGILALTKSASQEYARFGVRVNALVAGGFDTDMLRGAIRLSVGDDPANIEAALTGVAGMVPAGRIGRPEEAAEAALWLSSDAASYVTGHSFIVDGGLTTWAR